jgi:hypothetical protein
MAIQSQNPQKLNMNAVLLRQIGEALYGADWQAPLSRVAGVSDRSMRRWAAGTDDVPDGVWQEVHLHASSRWMTIKYFDEEIATLLKQRTQLRPISNSKIRRAHLGIHFALHTENGRPVRCFISREVFDDRVPRDPLSHTLNYFKDHADVFYQAAQRKFDAGDIAGDLISISNADVVGEDLPDIRSH